ncbi:MAG: hypothetical protein KAG53_01885 [Endozoicomonadaceae bacterium]|nr:hypothetical protein [Endozoicomonadaceae bacterium]
MDKITNDVSNKIILDSEDIHKESGNGARCKVRVVSGPVLLTGGSCDQRNSGSAISEGSKHNPLLLGSSRQRNITQPSLPMIEYVDAFENQQATPRSSSSGQHRVDEDIHKESDNGVRCKVRVVSGPVLLTGGSCDQRNSGSAISEGSKHNPLLLGSSRQSDITQPSLPVVEYVDAFEDQKATPRSSSGQHRVDEDIHKESGNGARCKVRVVSGPVLPTGSSCDQINSGGKISEGSKNNPLLLGSSRQRNITQPSLQMIDYVYAFEDRKATSHSSSSGQHRVDAKGVPSDTFHEARPQALDYYSNSCQDALIRDNVQKRLSKIDDLVNLNINDKHKALKSHVIIKNMEISDFTREDKVLFIKKMNLWNPLFTHMDWTTKSMLHRKFTSTGLFSFIKEETRCLQVELINSLILAIKVHCQSDSRLINPIGMASLLSDVKSVINLSLLKELDSELDDMMVEMLTVIASGKIIFLENSISSVMPAIVKFINVGRLSSTDERVKCAVNFLFECICQEREKLKYLKLESILIDIKALIEAGVMKGVDNRGIDVVISLLPCLTQKIEQPNERQISLLLFSIGFFVNKSAQKKRCHFNDIVRMLLCNIPKNQKNFNRDQIANIFSSFSALLDSGLIQPDELLFTEAVISLIPDMKKNIDKYDYINICIIVRCIGKITDKNINLVSKFQDVLENLVCRLELENTDDINIHYLSMMLWGVARLSSKVVFSTKSIDNINKIYLLTISYIKQDTQCFSANEVASFLWIYGKLIENKLIFESIIESSLTSFIDNKLKMLNVFFCVNESVDTDTDTDTDSDSDSDTKTETEDVISIMSGISRLLFYCSDVDMRLVDEFFIKVTTFLSGKKDEITMEDACSIIINIGRLIRRGSNCWTKSLEEFTNTLLTNTLLDGLIHKSIKEMRELFIKNFPAMCESFICIGLRLRNFKDLLRKMIQFNILSVSTSTKEDGFLLLSLTYFYSWYDEDELLKNDLHKLMIALLQDIENRLQNKNKELKEYPNISMAISAFWLEVYRNNDDVKYEISTSKTQEYLLTKLRRRYTDLEINSEISLNGLPPVDIIIPAIRFIMEINGPYHYLDKEERILNGKSVSKNKAYIRMGYVVINVVASEISTRDKKNLCFLYEEIDDRIAQYKANSIRKSKMELSYKEPFG